MKWPQNATPLLVGKDDLAGLAGVRVEELVCRRRLLNRDPVGDQVIGRLHLGQQPPDVPKPPFLPESRARVYRVVCRACRVCFQPRGGKPIKPPTPLGEPWSIAWRPRRP